MTNTVKHFKWTPRGKRRIHARPNRSEVVACRPWFDAELQLVHPELIVLLGATAAQGALGSTFRVTRDRGVDLRETALAEHVVATIHPSALLRIQDREERREAEGLFVRDLRVAAEIIRA